MTGLVPKGRHADKEREAWHMAWVYLQICRRWHKDELSMDALVTFKL